MLGLKLIHVSKRGLSYQWSTLVAGLTNTLLNSSTVCSDKQHRNMKALHYWPFERGIHQWLVDSPHKGPVMQKAFPCYDIMVDSPHKGPVMQKAFPCYDIMVDSPHKGPVMQKAFPCYDIMVDSPHKGPVMQKAFPCYDIMVDSPHKGPVISKSFPCCDIIMCEHFFLIIQLVHFRAGPTIFICYQGRANWNCSSHTICKKHTPHYCHAQSSAIMSLFRDKVVVQSSQ